MARRSKEEKIAYADKLRSSPTWPEQLVIDWLGRNEHRVPRWRFQEPIIGWIVDFYFPDHNIILEVNGGYHYLPEQVLADELRTKSLVGAGYTVYFVTARELRKHGTYRALSHLRHRFKELGVWKSDNGSRKPAKEKIHISDEELSSKETRASRWGKFWISTG